MLSKVKDTQEDRLTVLTSTETLVGFNMVHFIFIIPYVNIQI